MDSVIITRVCEYQPPVPPTYSVPASRSKVNSDGLTIVLSSVARKFTFRRIRRWLDQNGLHPKIAPRLTVRVQDIYASQASASVAGSGGTYTSFAASIYLKGTNSSFSRSPHSTLSHEYGH